LELLVENNKISMIKWNNLKERRVMCDKLFPVEEAMQIIATAICALFFAE